MIICLTNFSFSFQTVNKCKQSEWNKFTIMMKNYEIIWGEDSYHSSCVCCTEVGAIRMSTRGHSTIDRQGSFTYPSAKGGVLTIFLTLSLSYIFPSFLSLTPHVTGFPSPFLYFRLALVGSRTRFSQLYTVVANEKPCITYSIL